MIESDERAFILAFRAQFGTRALGVAQRQCAEATGGVLGAWQRIVAQLAPSALHEPVEERDGL